MFFIILSFPGIKGKNRKLYVYYKIYYTIIFNNNISHNHHIYSTLTK